MKEDTPPIKLTAEQSEAVAEALREFERGESLTPKQVRENARRQTQAWMKAKSDQSA